MRYATRWLSPYESSDEGSCCSDDEPATPLRAWQLPQYESGAETAWEKTDEQVKTFAEGLGLDVVRDADLVWLAQEALSSPMPAGWSEHVDTEGRCYLYNYYTDQSSWSHPTDELYRELIGFVKAVRKECPSASQLQRRTLIDQHLERAHERLVAQLEGWSGPYLMDGSRYYYQQENDVSVWEDPVQECENELAIRHRVLYRCLLADWAPDYAGASAASLRPQKAGLRSPRKHAPLPLNLTNIRRAASPSGASSLSTRSFHSACSGRSPLPSARSNGLPTFGSRRSTSRSPTRSPCARDACTSRSSYSSSLACMPPAPVSPMRSSSARDGDSSEIPFCGDIADVTPDPPHLVATMMCTPLRRTIDGAPASEQDRLATPPKQELDKTIGYSFAGDAATGVQPSHGESGFVGTAQKPAADCEIDLENIISELARDLTRSSVALPLTSNPEERSAQRRRVKVLLQQYPDLTCESFGFGAERQLHVMRQQRAGDVTLKTTASSCAAQPDVLAEFTFGHADALKIPSRDNCQAQSAPVDDVARKPQGYPDTKERQGANSGAESCPERVPETEAAADSCVPSVSKGVLPRTAG